MVVAFDAVGPSAAGTFATNNGILSWSHTCTGSNVCLIAGASMGPVATDAGFSLAADCAGVPMTSLGLIHSGSTNLGFVQLWVLAGPATGASTVTITASGGTPGTLVGGSVSFTGVDQTAPVGTAVTAASAGSASSISALVVGTGVGNMVVSIITSGSGGESATTGTLRWSAFSNNVTAAGGAAMSTIAAPGGEQAMSWTATNDLLGEIAVEVLAPPVGTLRLPIQTITVP